MANVLLQEGCWNVYTDDGALLASLADEASARHYAEQHTARKSKPNLEAVVPPKPDQPKKC